jgi:hypothetical protein
MSSDQPTLNQAVVPDDGPTFWNKVADIDWDTRLTDAMIYLIAIGGFYVGYQTLYAMATKVGMPDDQAAVVSAIADLAILAYSRKAVQEIKEGRSAWGIRLIVAIASLATVALQLRAAWPHPTSLGFHALAPAAWITGHEMMLRGRLRNAKAARRRAEIASGLRPAPLPAIRLSWWFLALPSTFTVWRLTKLWEKPQEYVIKVEAARLLAKGETIPTAWAGFLGTTAPALPKPVEVPTLGKEYKQPPLQLTGAPKITLQTQLVKESSHREPISPQTYDAFLRALPVAPVDGRPQDAATAYIREVELLTASLDIRCTGNLLAELLNVTYSRVSQLRKAIADEDQQAAALAAVSTP